MAGYPHTGRVAVVTGAARGFGRAIAEGLAANGAAILAVDIVDCSATLQAIEALGGTAVHARIDVTDPASVAAMTDHVRKHLGRCDILVNNVGIYPVRDFADVDYQLWRKVFLVNLDSQFLTTKAVVDDMKEQRWGRIVNITSNSISIAAPGLSHYIASKAGIVGFTRGLATDLAPYGITVNAVGPTATQTEGAEASGFGSQVIDLVAALQAIKRPGRPTDIVGLVSFLASEEAAFLTGQTIMVDGGLTGR